MKGDKIMKIKKTPLRKCIICANQFDKKSLTRIVKNNEGNIFVDKTFKANGRGAYICTSIECIDKFLKTRALDRAFKCKVDKQIYDDIISVIKSDK